MVKSKTLEISNFERLPAGQNASVAIMAYTGYDIEDAVILNRASLDRGFARAMYIKRFQTKLEKYPTGVEDYSLPPPQIPAPTEGLRYEKMKKYHALDKDGMARIGEKLSENDIYLNRYVPADSSLRKKGG